MAEVTLDLIGEQLKRLLDGRQLLIESVEGVKPSAKRFVANFTTNPEY